MTTDTDTTIKTSSTSALIAWRRACQAVETAANEYSARHTKATKLALRQAQAEEARRLSRYTEIRMHELNVVAAQQRRTH